MDDGKQRECPDCREGLVPINVVDRSHGSNFVGFAYTIDEAPKHSTWSVSKILNKAGTIHAYMCVRCDRVMFYASPGD
ncbi:MAG: hypothetical protein ACYTFG_06140 [Planctomycetota bacterium]|jgi:hypothetical protein